MQSSEKSMVFAIFGFTGWSISTYIDIGRSEGVLGYFGCIQDQDHVDRQSKSMKNQ